MENSMPQVAKLGKVGLTGVRVAQIGKCQNHFPKDYTITYYWRNWEQVDAYLQAWEEHGERMRREQERNPPPAVQRLRTMIRRRQLESRPYPASD
jgi:phage terminase small subunit